MNTDKKINIEREIAKAEKELKRRKEELAKLRHRLPKQEVDDFAFQALSGEGFRLSRLFGDKKDLILIRNMGKQCPYCTTWADGFNGVLHHLEDRAAFAVVSPDDPIIQKEFAESRGWKFKMISSQGTDFGERKELDPDDNPGVDVFQKSRDGKIFRVAKSNFCPGDNYCIVFDLFALLLGGANDWHPKFTY